jgi:hypothetical protein
MYQLLAKLEFEQHALAEEVVASLNRAEILTRYALSQPEPEVVGVTDFEEELMAAWDKAILLPRTGRLAEYRAWLAHALALVWAVGRRPTTEQEANRG